MGQNGDLTSDIIGQLNQEASGQLNDEAVNRFNLMILKSKDSFIDKILFMSPLVAQYQHNDELRDWTSNDVVGALFVVQRTAEPKYRFIVVNRRNPGDLVENLDANFKFEVQSQFLTYSNTAADVNKCLWVPNEDHLSTIAELFRRIVEERSNVVHPESQVIEPALLAQRTPDNVVSPEPEFSSSERIVDERSNIVHPESEVIEQDFFAQRTPDRHFNVVSLEPEFSSFKRRCFKWASDMFISLVKILGKHIRTKKAVEEAQAPRRGRKKSRKSRKR